MTNYTASRVLVTGAACTFTALYVGVGLLAGPWSMAIAVLIVGCLVWDITPPQLAAWLVTLVGIACVLTLLIMFPLHVIAFAITVVALILLFGK